MAKCSTSAANEPIAHRDLVTLLIDAAGTGAMRFVEWPPDKKRIDIGSFYSDSTQVQAGGRLAAPRQPARRLARDAGILRRHLPHYLDEPAPDGVFQ